MKLKQENVIQSKQFPIIRYTFFFLYLLFLKYLKIKLGNIHHWCRLIPTRPTCQPYSTKKENHQWFILMKFPKMLENKVIFKAWLTPLKIKNIDGGVLTNLDSKPGQQYQHILLKYLELKSLLLKPRQKILHLEMTQPSTLIAMKKNGKYLFIDTK